MTTYATDYVETSILNVYLRGYKFVTASPVYIALYTTAPTDSTNGTEVVASAGTLYKRISASGVDNNPFYNTTSGIEEYDSKGEPLPPPLPSTSFLVSDGSATNLFQIDFPARGGTTWGTVTHFAIVSGSWLGASGSNIFFYGPLETSATLGTGDIISFPVNSINIFLQGNFSKYIANNVLNYYLNGYTPNMPGLNVKAGLFITLPDSYGYNGKEVIQNSTIAPTGYTRQKCGGDSFWTEPATYNGVTSASSKSDLIFTTSAIQDWGAVKGVGIFDSVRNQLLFTASFVNKDPAARTSLIKQILMGDSFKLGQGLFRVTID